MIGIGLKAQHVAELLARPPVLDFVEVHAENYMVRGGPFLAHLERVRERHALSVHGVGLSIGGAGPLDADHLVQLAVLVRRFEPRWFSEHLAWSRHAGVCFNDLLPVPYDNATLQCVCDHVDRLQERLCRRMLWRTHRPTWSTTHRRWMRRSSCAKSCAEPDAASCWTSTTPMSAR